MNTKIVVCIASVIGLAGLACSSGARDENPPDASGGMIPGGSGGSAGTGSGGLGGSGATGGSGETAPLPLPFADCHLAPLPEPIAIEPSLIPDSDPNCDSWEDMPPLVPDENGEVRIGTGDAYRGFAVSGCMVAYGTKIGEVYLYDLATNRQRRVQGFIATPHSLALEGNAIAFDSLECNDEGDCTAGMEIQDVMTCRRGRTGIRDDHGSGPGVEYRSLVGSGGKLLWTESPPGGCQAVGMLDLRTAEWSTLTPIAGGICNAGPSIGGDWVTWTFNEADGTVVKLRNLLTGEERQISPSGQTSLYPDTDGRFVVWSKGDGAASDLFAYEIVSGAVTPVVVERAMQTEARVIDGKVTWTDLRDSSTEVYGFTSAHYERVLPDGEPRLVRPARTPLIYGRDVGKGLVWMDGRTRDYELWAMPAR